MVWWRLVLRSALLALGVAVVVLALLPGRRAPVSGPGPAAPASPQPSPSYTPPHIGENNCVAFIFNGQPVKDDCEEQ